LFPELDAGEKELFGSVYEMRVASSPETTFRGFLLHLLSRKSIDNLRVQ
jgi:hypothetical protein